MSELSMTPTAGIGIAVAQFAPTTDQAGNLAAIRELTSRASSRGAQVVVFPEYSSYFIDPFDASLAEYAEDIDGPFVTGLQAIALDHRVVIVAGLVERAGVSGRIHNTVIAVDGSNTLATYRKQHLYDAFGQRESDWVEAGDTGAPQTFAYGGLRFGLQTCYDIRFPEVTRTLVDAGADVVLVAAEWVRGPLKEHHWLTLLTARAIENTVFVVAADQPPPLGVGHSVIIDPAGVTMASVGTTTDVAVSFLDRDTLERVRTVNPALALRRYRVEPVSHGSGSD